jgi:tetratricopeptide (TPR) repeat protein
VKFFIRAQLDDIAIDRCFFDADNGRPGLAVDRLRDLAEQIPANPHISYAEGIIRRDNLGQGLNAFQCFDAAYSLAIDHLKKQDTARIAAYNAAMSAPNEKEFRRWVELAIRACGDAHAQDRRLLSGLVAELDRGVKYVRLLIHRVEKDFDNPTKAGHTAAILDLVLRSSELTEELVFTFRRNRSLALRALDLRVQNLREAMNERYSADERTMLREALQELECALSIDEYDATLWNSKAAWLGLLDEHVEAIKAADCAIKLRPALYARPHVNKAYSLYQLGRSDEALACIREAMHHAQAENSPEQVEQARVLMRQYSQPKQVLQGSDFTVLVNGLRMAAVRTAQKELALLKTSGITLEMVVGRLRDRINVLAGGSPTEFVPMAAQLLGDFTPETGWVASCEANQKDRRVGPHMIQACAYLAAHIGGVQRRDAASLLALLILVVPDLTTMRRFYRKYVLEPSSADNGAFAHLDKIMRDQLGRLHADLPQLIGDQDPVDEAGKERARHTILKSVGDPPPAPIVANTQKQSGTAVIAQDAGGMKLMKWKPFLFICATMASIAMYFQFLNSKPENIINHVILSVRAIAEAQSTGNDTAKEAAIGRLNYNVEKLKEALSKVSGTPTERASVYTYVIERLMNEQIVALENAPDRPSATVEVHRFREIRKYVDATQALLGPLISDLSQKVSPEEFESIATKYRGRFQQQSSRLGLAPEPVTPDRVMKTK